MDTIKVAVNMSLIILISYLMGSIPTSIIVSKLSRGIDIRNHGSGNAGGTNTFRVLGWKAGFIVVTIDILKGFISAAWVSQINLFNLPINTDLTPVLTGSAAIIGHCYTVFAGFKGGKGVATSAGMLIAIMPVSFFICLAVFATMLTISGYVSLSSMSAAAVFPMSLLVLRFISPDMVSMPFLVFSGAAGGFVLYSHRSNMKRLIAGKENRFDKVRIFMKK